MSKRKSRASLLMSDSLATKLDDAEKSERDTLYTPVKDTKFDFFDVVGEAIDSEEVVQVARKGISGGTILGIIACAIVLVVLVVIVDGILL